jgi:hypothetical protein
VERADVRPRVWIPSGIYTFDALGRLGRLQVDELGRTIVQLQASLGCWKRLTLANIPIRRDGSYRLRIVAGGRRQATVRLDGTFTSDHVARGTIRATHVACDTGNVAFTGRLG